jgi:hypothetical protein
MEENNYNRTAINRPLTGMNGRGICVGVIMDSGLRLCRFRNGYVKKTQ